MPDIAGVITMNCRQGPWALVENKDKIQVKKKYTQCQVVISTIMKNQAVGGKAWLMG